jgi:cell pole-organizing protein PopZ
MEEILASIRRIIADEKDEPIIEALPEEPKEDVVDLTQMVSDDGSIVEVTDPFPEPEKAPEPKDTDLEFAEPFVAAAPSPPVAAASAHADDALISSMAASAAASSLAALANRVEMERVASANCGPMLGNGAMTLEAMVKELMKPLLKAWLDENLPSIVERIVLKEVERITHKIQD